HSGGEAPEHGGRARRDPDRGDAAQALHLDRGGLPPPPARSRAGRPGAGGARHAQHPGARRARHLGGGGRRQGHAGGPEARPEALQGGGGGGRDHRRGPARCGDRALRLLLTCDFWLIIIGAVLSWVSPDPRNPIVRFIYGVTEPVLYQVRRRLPFVIVGGLDLSPIVVILAIMFAQTVIVQSLRRLA